MSTDLLLVQDNPADAWLLQLVLARYPGEYTMTVAGNGPGRGGIAALSNSGLMPPC